MDAEALIRALGGRWHGRSGLAPCPVPGHGQGLGDRHPSLSIAAGEQQALIVHCHGGCDPRDVLAEVRHLGLSGKNHTRAPDLRRLAPDRLQRREGLPASLWQRALPLKGSPASDYLKQRGLGRALPATLRYLPAAGTHPHAMIAAFGLAGEAEPGCLTPPETPPAVHLTRLLHDGLTRTDKRMLGPVSGHPIVLAPPNDGLGLVIAEGIEDALSLHAATGLGAWAGGSAGHMAKLGQAVPDHIECVTLAEDANEAGRRACERLGEDLLRRGMEVRVLRIRA